MYKKTLIFAGTSEGHDLARYFDEKDWNDRADFCVATKYGTEVLEDVRGLSVIQGRLDEKDIEQLLSGGVYAMVIDATHPYAKEVTENIKNACEAREIRYLRLIRKEGIFDHPCVRTVHSAEEAAEILQQEEGKILLTTGSKELSKYETIADRIVARVLPSHESLNLCGQAGILPQNIIGMQGPFTKEMNLAVMKQYGCRWLVTKNTGKPGGFDDKIACAEAGFHIIVIDRPSTETGYSYREIIEKLEEFYG